MVGEPPPRSPIEDFAAGLARGTFEAAAPGVKKYLTLLLNHKLAFIGRRDYILEVKEMRKSPEWLLYRDYLQDKQVSILAQMGLTLRDWESDPARVQDIHNLRNRIHKKFGEEGLHIAQVVQSQILTGVVPVVVSHSTTKERAAQLIEAFLKDSFRLCRFVRTEDQPPAVGRAISDHLVVNRPAIFVLFGRGTALEILNRTVVLVSEGQREYAYQVHDIDKSRIVVFVRSDLLPKRNY